MNRIQQFKSIALLLWLLIICQFTFAQNKTVTGRVVDSKDRAALANVSVIANGTNFGTQTDSNGNFRLTIPSSVKTLTFSSIGYSARNVEVNKTDHVEVTLTSTASSLDQIVVIGYGMQQRKDITGAIDRIAANEFNKGIITNPMQQLQSKVAGLVISQPGGDPNGELTVRLRGATSLEGQPPLLVIDGVAIDDFYKALATLNPSDVESYDVLKDASAAAIYGSRGANGVILVTTKRGRAGKMQVEYNGFVGVEKVSNTFNVLNAQQWRKATASMNAASLDAGGDMDWQKAMLQTAITQSHTISFSGASDQLNIYGSVGYTRQEGLIINSGKEAVTGRLSAIQYALKNKLEIRLGINTSVTNRDFLWDQSSTNQSRLWGTSVFGTAVAYLPVWPAYKPDGSYYQPPTNAINPLFFLNEIYSKQRENFFQLSSKIDYRLVKGLRIGVLGAMSRANDVYDRFQPKFPGTSSTPDAASKNNYNKQNYSGDIHGNYHKNFGKNVFDVTGVYEYNRFLNDGFGLTATGFLVPDLLNNNLGAATNVQTHDIFSNKTEVKLISFLARVVYNYNDRYILTSTFRRDGSSKFGPNNRWGNFPSLAFAWRASNEHFLRDLGWLTNLKLRISYGLTGNQEDLPPNQYQLLYGPAGPYLSNGRIFQSYTVTQEYNPDLKWEVRKSFNIGADFSLFNDRMSGTFEIYNDHVDDMLFLYDIPQPPFLTNKVYANAASAINKGIEVTLGGLIVQKKNFSWSSSANLSTLKNYITKLLGQFKGVDLSVLDPSYGYVPGTSVTRLKVGYPAGVFWLPRSAGLDGSGHQLYYNYDADGKLTGTSTSYSDQDKFYVDPTPDFTWGFTNNFTYKNFDLTVFLRGVQGQKIFAGSLFGLESLWFLPGGNVTDKALTTGLIEQPQASTYWLQNGSYIRLDNITLGYNFKSIKGVHKARLYFTATNLFVISKYEGIDPEIRTEGSQRYIDYNNYPKTRGFVFGVAIGI